MLSRQSKKKILIVDDELGICEFLRERLKEEFEVKTVLTGEEAIRILASESFDLCITDLKLSDEYMGEDVIKACRKLRPAAKIIAMTGIVDKELKDAILALGVNDYAHKPSGIQPHVMYERVIRLLKERGD
ncbi:MAG: response regulator [Candidatus Omnitrophica bacterium]|nr:response regulator [Candidatus Omnitrophota bacterium]